MEKQPGGTKEFYLKKGYTRRVTFGDFRCLRVTFDHT